MSLCWALCCLHTLDHVSPWTVVIGMRGDPFHAPHLLETGSIPTLWRAPSAVPILHEVWGSLMPAPRWVTLDLAVSVRCRGWSVQTVCCHTDSTSHMGLVLWPEGVWGPIFGSWLPLTGGKDPTPVHPADPSLSGSFPISRMTAGSRIPSEGSEEW